MKYKGRDQSSNIEDKRPQLDFSYLMSPQPIGVKTASTFQKEMTTQQNYSFQTDIKKNGS